MYTEENSGLLAQSYPTNNSDAWVQGDMTKLLESTNTALLGQGKLYPYNNHAGIYHCPADQGVLAGGKLMPSVRSYAMNSFMGGRPDPEMVYPPIGAGNYVPFFTKDSEIPLPSQTWVLIDEDERSIDDGSFTTDPTGHVWFELPAMSAHRHNFSFSMIFADSHSEVWRYNDPASFRVPETWSGSHAAESSNNRDLVALAKATTSPK
jgi:hypothetical protein